MAVSPLDKPPYTPLFPPPVQSVDLQQVENWVKQELDTIARYTTAQPGTLFTPGNAIPARPRTGILTYADGTNWNPGYGEGLYVYKGGIWVPVGVGAGSRIRLSTATSFNYKPSTGNNANDGSAGSPWASPSPLWSRYDFGGQDVTLNLLENTTVPFILDGWTGGGSLTLDGGGHSITVTNGHCIDSQRAAISTSFTYKNLTLSTITSGNCINHFTPGLMIQGSGVTFAACAARHLNAQFDHASRISIRANWTCTGGAVAHFGLGAGFIDTFANVGNFNLTLVGNPQFQAFAFVAAGVCDLGGFSFSGTATGYESATVFLNGILGEGLGGVSDVVGGVPHLPGNGRVSTSSGGRYTP